VSPDGTRDERSKPLEARKAEAQPVSKPKPGNKARIDRAIIR